MRGCRVLAKDFQGFDSADAGQVDVHEDHIGLIGARQLDAQAAVFGGQQADIGTCAR